MTTSTPYGIVYKTTNLVNGKQYVGQTIRVNSFYLGSGTYFLRSLKKYGRHNFIRETLCECSNRDELNEREMDYIKKLNTGVPNGYNILGTEYCNSSEHKRTFDCDKVSKYNAHRERITNQIQLVVQHCLDAESIISHLKENPEFTEIIKRYTRSPRLKDPVGLFRMTQRRVSNSLGSNLK